MGILDNLASSLASRIVKAAPVAEAITQSQIQQALQAYGNSVGLERDPRASNVPFTPGVPLVPGAINPVRPDGRPDPRRYEFQVAQNINVTETRLVPFKTLRASAEQIDILRRCVEVLKQKMIGLDWDIVLAEDAVEQVMDESGETSYAKAMMLAKEKYSEDINRLKQFWEVPDVQNGLIFSDWLNMALEDILVLDAWAVWPQKTVGGDLRGLQILDGSTIKPLIDDRGMRPENPFPAFQQILYGFPRSEFSASDESIEADGEFCSDELSYLIRNRRTNSVYGYSPVERALPLADIYLRRQQWLRAEYTDGVLPELMFKTDANFGNNPDLLRAYENIFNDDLAGQTEQRKRARLLPTGLDPVQMDGYGEKFQSTLDEYLVVAICGHFGVQPSEIGFAQSAGLNGGAGLQAGQGLSSEVIGLLPLATWVGKMLSQLSSVYLGMPRALEFRFAPSKRNDDEAITRAIDMKVRGARMTINEARSRDGLPLIDTPEADQLLLLTGAGGYFIGDDGIVPLADGLDLGSEEPEIPEDESVAPVDEDGKPVIDPAAEEPSDTDIEPIDAGDEGDEASDPEEADEEAPISEDPADEEDPEDEQAAKKKPKPDDAIKSEVKSFMRWLRKSPTRAFEFEHLEPALGEALNKFVEVQDYEAARWYAERYLA